MGWTTTIPYRLRQLVAERSQTPGDATRDDPGSADATAGPAAPMWRELEQESTRRPAPAAPSVYREPVERMPAVPVAPTANVRSEVERMPAIFSPAMPDRNLVAADAVSRMRPETITPQPAPGVERMTMRPDFVGDVKREALEDPNLRRPAIIDQTGIAPAQYDWINSDTPMLTRPEPRKIERGGVGGTLKSILRGGLQGLALGGRMGGGQGIGGAIAGAIQGGISPQSVENTYNDQFRMPRYEHDKAEAENDIAHKEQLIEGIATRTGVDPTTGRITPQREQQKGELDARREGIRATIRNQQEQDKDRDTAMAMRALADWDHRHPGEPYPAHVTNALPHLKGESAPKVSRPPATEYSQTKVGPGGVEYGQRKDTGQWEPTTTTEGEPFKRLLPKPDDATPHQRFEESRQIRQDVDRNVSDARREMQLFEVAKKKVGEAAAKYSAMKQALDSGGLYKGKFIDDSDVEEAEAAYHNLQAEFQGARPTHRYVKLGEWGEDEHHQRKFFPSLDGTAIMLDQASVDADRQGYAPTAPAKRAAASTSAPPRPSSNAGKVPVMSQANVAEAARRKGMTPEQFVQFFTSHGGVIQ